MKSGKTWIWIARERVRGIGKNAYCREELADLKGSDARVLSKKEKKLEAQNGGKKKFQMQKSRGGDSERLPDHGVEGPRAHKHKGSHVTEGKRGKKRKILLGTLLQPLLHLFECDMLARLLFKLMHRFSLFLEEISKCLLTRWYPVNLVFHDINYQ